MFDPLVFAVAKAVVGWAVWYRGVVGGEGLGTVEGAVGREVLVVVGSAVVGGVGVEFGGVEWVALLSGRLYES